MDVTTKGPLRLERDDVESEPFPHVIRRGLIDPALYARLVREFPCDDVFDRNVTTGARAGRDLYRGDPAYGRFLESSSAWREFHDYINSQRFVSLVLELFGEHLARFGCLTDPHTARFVDYVEGREVLADKSRLRRKLTRLLRPTQDRALADELFVRLDLAQGAKGYAKPVHCDRPNRLASMLVYFCSADEVELEGGELRIHEHLERKDPTAYERHPQEARTRVLETLRAEHNLGLIFLCANNSYHSVSAVERQSGYRNFAYISVAARRRSIWPHA